MSPEVDLFRLSASSPEGAPHHGSAVFGARAGADADFRRGIDLHATFDMEARFDASYRAGLAASLNAGAGLRAGLSLQACLPLDLFDEAGLVARLRAQAEASAFISAGIGLEAEVFKSLLRERIGEGPFVELLEIFLDEVVVEAGFWARASASAQVVGEAALTGTLLPGPGRAAGFSFRLEGSAGLGFGAGAQFGTNVGIEDPKRMLDRLGRRIADVAVDEIAEQVAKLPAAQRGPAEAALILVRPLIAVAVRGGFATGVALASGKVEDSRDEAGGAIVMVVARELQEQLLRALVEAALEQLGTALGAPGLDEAFLAMDDARRGTFKQALRSAAQAFGRAGDASAGDDAWVDALVDGAVALGSLLTALGDLPFAARLRPIAGKVTAGLVLLQRLRELADDDAAALAAGNAKGPLAGAAGDTLGRGASTAVALADLVEALAGPGAVARALQAVPGVEPVLRWAAEALDLASPEELVGIVLADLDSASGAEASQLLTRIGAATGRAIEKEVVPRVIAPVRTRAPEPVRVFLDTVVVPLMTTLPVVVMPRLPGLADEEGRRRLREAVSAVLLQALGRCLVATTDVLLKHALREGQVGLRGVAGEIERFGEQQPAFAVVAGAYSRALVPIAPNVKDIAEVVRIAADVLEHLDRHEREPVMRLFDTVLRLAFDDPSLAAARDQTLLATDEPFPGKEIDRLLDQVTDGALELVGIVVPRALELYAKHWVHEVELAAAAIEAGARAVVEKVEQAIAVLRQGLAALEQEIARLADQARRLAASIAGDVNALAEHLRRRTAAAVAAIKAYGWSLIAPLIDWAPGFIVDAFRDLYSSLFAALGFALDAPLAALSAVSGWVRDGLMAQVQGARVDAQALKNATRDRLLGSEAHDLHFDLAIDFFGWGKIDLGRITIPAPSVLEQVAGVAFDPTFDATVNGCARAGEQLRVADAERAGLEQARAGQMSELDAKAALGDLRTGRPVRVTISDPRPGVAYGPSLTATIRVEGANASFVRSAMGVPRRISVRLNGREYPYTSEQWREEAGGLRLDLVITAGEVRPPAPQRVQRPARLESQAGALLEAVGSAGPAGRVLKGAVLAAPRARAVDAEGDMVALAGRALSTRQPHDVVAVAPRGMRAATLLADALHLEPTRVIGVALPGAPPTLPPGLNTLQVAVGDGGGSTARASVAFYLGAVAPRPTRVEIADLVANPPGPDVRGGERVVLRSNRDEPIDLEGWTVRDLARHTYTFGSFTLPARGTVTLWTRAGADDAENLHWGRTAAVWNNRGDAAILEDDRGREVARRAC